jgi:FG-GAP repeat
VTPTPAYCADTLDLANLENLSISVLRSTSPAGWRWEVTRAEAPQSDLYGFIYDYEDIYNDQNTYPAQPAAVRFVSQDEPINILEGDYLVLTYDASTVTYVYPPPVSGSVDVYYYIGRDGSTYSDRWLCELVKGVPTPTSTPAPSGTPTPSQSPTPSVTQTQTPTPKPTVASTVTPPATPTPQTTSTPSPSPSATIIRCFNVSGRVTLKSDASPVAGAQVRAYVPGGTSPVSSSDGNGNYRTTVCTHIPDGKAWVGARLRDYLPMSSSATYSEWTDVDGINIELAPASTLPGIVSGDFNGDGLPDIAVFRPATSLWAVRGVTQVYFGDISDDLIPADYNGDGTSQVAIFRGATGLWAILNVTRIYFGNIADLPAPGDYTGNGTCEIAVFRNPIGLWAIRGFQRCYYGTAYDQSLPGDYDGDGIVEPAIFRSGMGLWAIQRISRLYYGRVGDRTIPEDYDGDGIRDPAIFRPCNGLWAIKGFTRIYFGNRRDDPIPADYNGNGVSQIAVFRDATGLWAIRNSTRLYFGRVDDIPVTR